MKRKVSSPSEGTTSSFDGNVYFKGGRCICSKPERCALMMQRISNIPGCKCTWVSLPSAPKNIDRKVSENEAFARDLKRRRREVHYMLYL